MTPRLRSQTGLSLVEVAIIMGVMVLLSGVLAPAGFELIAQARDVRALRDAEALRGALLTLLNDLGQMDIRVRSGRGPAAELLVTGGAVPRPSDPETTGWTREVDGAGVVDLIERHLVTNEAANASLQWLPPSRPGGPGWRGAYLRSSPGSDPWGHRYAVNVKFLGRRLDVLVLSAGPNGLVETPFEARSLRPGGDDIGVLVR